MSKQTLEFYFQQVHSITYLIGERNSLLAATLGPFLRNLKGFVVFVRHGSQIRHGVLKGVGCRGAST